MINLNSNLRIVVQAKLHQVEALKGNIDPVLRTVALTVLPELKERVHVRGMDSNNQQIGTYSKGYMVVRTGNYKDGAKYKKGAKAGQYKEKKSEAKGDAGVHSKGANAGANRPVYNRTSDTKVIWSLTRQMENDLTVVAVGRAYGIGYLNPFNRQKVTWLEEMYDKKVLTKLTADERQLALQTAKNFLPEYLKELA